MDPGESDMQTALRETEEEAGLSKSDLKIYEDAKQELNYDVKGKPKTVIYWLAELVNKDKEAKLSDEHQDLKWLGFDDACKISNYGDMQQSLKYFDDYISKNLM